MEKPGKGRKREKLTPAVVTNSRPLPPPYLKGAALEQFNDVVEKLEAKGTLGQTDPVLIETYAMNYQLMVRVYDDLTNDTLVDANTKDGRKFKHPLLESFLGLSQKVRQCISDLGLTPVSASRTDANPTEENNPLSAFLQSAKKTSSS